MLSANPLISEFMADNASTLADEDGAYSDWIEIHNPTANPIDLTGWKLTDNSANLSKWSFPAVSLAPGEFRVFFASGKSAIYPHHTNFSLSKGGEFLALVRPDGGIEQQFSPQFPSQAADESYGKRFVYTRHIAPSTAWKYRIPTSGSLDALWKNLNLNDASWSTGNSGLGFGTKIPGISVRQVFYNNYIGSLATADAALVPSNSGILSESSSIVTTVNFLGNGSEGRYGNNALPPGGNGDNYVIQGKGWIEIPTAGTYTFGLNSDDGGRIRINGADVMVDDTNHGPEDHLGSVFLAAGQHSFEFIMFQGYGGNCVEFYSAPGSHTQWNATNFDLVGDTANGGLSAFTIPEGSTGSLIATNLESVMRNIRATAYLRKRFTASGPGTATSLSLVNRYNDGFVAWLNETQIAAQNAPASPNWTSVATAARTESSALIPQGFNVTSALTTLQSGNNVLAIQGLNVSSADTTFLQVPELISGSPDATNGYAFYGEKKATPGWVNTEFTLLGKVADTQFSVKRGIFSDPFTLTITTTTPGATIRYTTDGSTPTATTGTIYTAPLTIASTTNLRAAAFLTDWEATDVDTQTYLFPDDIITQQANGSPPPGWPSNSGTAQVLDYGMDPEIVNSSNPDIGGPTVVKNALLALPSVVITTDLPNLFNMNGSQGFFSNPYGRGLAWERPASLEWINPPDALNPNGTSEFQINAGVRMRGGFSRSEDNPKHAFHLYFRQDYGDTKLDYPLFGRHGSQSFDRIDFRTAQNYSWSFGGDGNNTFLREEATRIAQLDMGQAGSRVRYIHLYLNGVYWGLFNLDERTEAAFSASYFGGNKDEYDVIKAEQDSGYITGVTDGNLNAWQNLWNLSRSHHANPTNANYFKMMGKAADGVTPTLDPVLLDVDNLIDYMMLTFWSGNLDGCMSAFLGNVRANNWFGSRRSINNPGEGFRFFAHDFEHSFFNVNEDRTGPFGGTEQADFLYSNPYYLHLDLLANAEYKMRWADRVQKHMFAGGALSPTAWSNRFNALAAEIDLAIIAESARWGDAKSGTPLTKNNWLNARNDISNYLSPRHSIVVDQLRNDGLFPAIDSPVLAPSGGYQPSGTEVTMTGPANSTLYYMPDGSDPRAVGGSLRAGALVFVSNTTNEMLIPWSASNWKYLSNNSNQGTAWRNLAFNDNTWNTGTAELGYGDGDEATAITRPDPRYATCYFRKSFSLANAAQISNLSLRIEYDDAYAVYLNGTRIAGNLPIDPAFNYFSNDAIEDTELTINNIPTNLLLEGNNVIAVEIHQANTTSSDISMNCSLSATRANTSTPFQLIGTGEKKLQVRARHNTTTEWSALADATYFLNTTAPAALNLAISEIMYHPTDPSPTELAAGFIDADDFEFIEIVNTGTSSIDLRGLYIYDAVGFDFDNSTLGTTLAAGARIILAARRSAFEFRYGTSLPVAGSYTGNLNNAGETITIRDDNDAIIRQVSYQPINGWPTEADGAGYSLVAITPDQFANDNNGSYWRPSNTTQGNPGTSDATYWTSWANAHNLTDPQADPDADGIPNLLEYAMGGNPTVSNPELMLSLAITPVTLNSITDDYIQLTHPQKYGTDSVLVFLESSTNLQGPWTTEDLLLSRTRDASGKETIIHRSATPVSSQDRKFWRIRAQLR